MLAICYFVHVNTLLTDISKCRRLAVFVTLSLFGKGKTFLTIYMPPTTSGTTLLCAIMPQFYMLEHVASLFVGNVVNNTVGGELSEDFEKPVVQHCGCQPLHLNRALELMLCTFDGATCRF